MTSPSGGSVRRAWSQATAYRDSRRIVRGSSPIVRRRTSTEVDLSGVYDPRTKVVDVEVRVLNDRVGGGT